MRATHDLLDEVLTERVRQHVKWGEQNHPDRMTMYGTPVLRMAYGIEHGDTMRARCKAAGERGEDTWDRILLEEVAEAMDECAIGNTAALREELVQVAAVAVAWVEAMDRRSA